MSELYVPDSLKVGATYSQSKVNRIKTSPVSGSGSYGPGSIVRFAFPTRSILRLSSVSIVADLTISNLVKSATETSIVNALIPYSSQLISRCNWICNGISLTPSSNYDQISNQLTRLTASEDWCRTRCMNGALNLIQNTDDAANPAHQALNANPDAGAASKVTQIVIDDLLGLCRGNGSAGVIDCGVFGDVQLELTLNTANCLKVFKGTGASAAELAAVTYSLSNISLQCDAIVSVSNDYLAMMQVRLQNSKPLNYAFQNFNSQIQSHGGTGVITHSVSTSCLDVVVAAPLKADYDTRVSHPITQPQANRYTYNSGRTHATQGNTQISFNIGSTAYPQNYNLTAFEALDSSCNCFGVQDRYANNLLCAGVTDAAVNTTVYGRQFFLSDNAIFAMALSNESEGWASKDRILSGISTMGASNNTVSFNFTNFGVSSGFISTTLLYTSVLQYDPATAQVSLIQ